MNEVPISQVPNGFGSCNGENDKFSGITGIGRGGAEIAWQRMSTSGAIELSGNRPSLDVSSQSSVGGTVWQLHQQPIQHYVTQPKNVRMGRRVSDGGPYGAAYKLFIEKRNPQLPLIRSNNNIEKCDSAQMSSSNSVRKLLQETQEMKCYGGLPHSRKEWIQFKNQVIQVNNVPRWLNFRGRVIMYTRDYYEVHVLKFSFNFPPSRSTSSSSFPSTAHQPLSL